MADRERQRARAALLAAVETQVREAYAIGPGAVVSVVLTLLERYEQMLEAEIGPRVAQFAAHVAALEARITALDAARRKTATIAASRRAAT